MTWLGAGISIVVRLCLEQHSESGGVIKTGRPPWLAKPVLKMVQVSPRPNRLRTRPSKSSIGLASFVSKGPTAETTTAKSWACFLCGDDEVPQLATQARSILATLRSWLGLTPVDDPSDAGTLVFDGDSIACGTGAPPGRTLADQVVRRLRFRGRVHVVAIGGSLVLQREQLFDTVVAPLYQSGLGTNIILFHAGDNDIAMGADAEATYRRLTSYVARAHDQGWVVVVSTEMQRFDFSPEQQRELLAYNAVMLENGANADGIVDFGNDPIMGGPENRGDPRLYTADRVHPTKGGYAILAEAASRELRRHLGGASAPTQPERTRP